MADRRDAVPRSRPDMAGGNAPGTVQVEGAKELRLAHEATGRRPEGPDGRQQGRRAAGPRREPAPSVPRVSGTLGRSIRLTASRSGASVRAGKGSRALCGPDPFRLEMAQHRPRSRLLFEAIDQRRQEVFDIYNGRVQELVRRLNRRRPSEGERWTTGRFASRTRPSTRCGSSRRHRARASTTSWRPRPGASWRSPLSDDPGAPARRRAGQSSEPSAARVPSWISSSRPRLPLDPHRGRPASLADLAYLDRVGSTRGNR